MKAIMTTFILLLLACKIQAQASEQELRNIQGTFASGASEDWGNGTFGYRQFSFEDGKWSLQFTLALDSDMRMKVFEFRTFGSYEILGPSEVGKGVYEALFYEDRKFVTLLTDNEELINGFGLSNCGLETGTETDISTNGCAIWPSIQDCREDHDLLKLSGNKLYFGVRPADNNMCTEDKRPTALLPPVVRQKSL